MWHYALALCMKWGLSGQCADLHLLPQDGWFATHELCQAAAVIQQDRLYGQPGWKTVIRGTVCTQSPWDSIDDDERVYTTHVRPD